MAMIIAKIIVFTVNFVLWASGILLIVFGGIALGSPDTIVNLLDLISGVSFITNLIDVGTILEGMAIFMIVVGSFLFIFGGVGCHGFHRGNEKSMKIYSGMLFLGILAEIGVIIYGGVYPGTTQGWIQSQMYQSLSTYFVPVTIQSNGGLTYSNVTVEANSWEFLQTQTQCCGAYGPNDYANLPPLSIANYPNAKLPPTCCTSTLPAGQAAVSTSNFYNITACLNNVTNYYYTQGCYSVTMNMLWNFDYIAMIIAGCLIAAQILAAIFTIHTAHRMIRDKAF